MAVGIDITKAIHFMGIRELVSNNSWNFSLNRKDWGWNSSSD